MTSEQATLDAAQKKIDTQQASLTESKATLKAQAAKLTDGSTILTLAQNIRQVSADGAVATGTVRFAGATADVPIETKSAVVEKIRAHPVKGVQTEFSSALSQTTPRSSAPVKASVFSSLRSPCS